MTHRLSRRPGFTPVSLIVVLAVLLILAGLLIPAVQRVREAAARTQSMNNLKQMGLAIHNFAAAYNALPPGVGEFGNKTGSLHLFILPFIEQQNLFNNATTASWDNEVWSKIIPIYVDPRDSTAPPAGVFQDWLATTSYAANGMVFSEKPAFQIGNIPDGTSNTLMFGTRYQVCNGTPCAWGYPSLYTWAPLTAYYNQALFQVSPRPQDCDPKRAQAIGGVMMIGMCDGSVRTVNPRVSAQTWANVCDPADGMALGADF
jgi:type II secretory pathway pseudopilin PulG